MQIDNLLLTSNELLARSIQCDALEHVNLKDNEILIQPPTIQMLNRNKSTELGSAGLTDQIDSLRDELKEASSELLTIENDALDVRWHLCEYYAGLKEQQVEINEELQKCSSMHPETTEHVKRIQRSYQRQTEPQVCEVVNKLRSQFPNYHLQQSDTLVEGWDSAICAFEVALEDQAKYESELEALNKAIAKEKQKQKQILNEYSARRQASLRVSNGNNLKLGLAGSMISPRTSDPLRSFEVC